MTSPNQRWHKKKRWIFLILFFFPPLGIVLVWLSQWPRWSKVSLSIMSGVLLLSTLGAPDRESVTSDTPSSAKSEAEESTETPQIALNQNEVDPKNQIAQNVKSLIGTLPEGIPLAQHQEMPVFVRNEAEYIVLDQDIGPIGQLYMLLVSVSSGEEIPIVSNCLDISNKGSDADLRLGETVMDIEETFKTTQVGYFKQLSIFVAINQQYRRLMVMLNI